MTTDSSPRRGVGAASAGASSPHNRKNNNHLPSPWAQVVQGKPSDSNLSLSPSSSSSPTTTSRVPEQSSFTSDCSPRKASPPPPPPPPQEGKGSDEGNGNAGKPKKPAWSMPVLTANGVGSEPSSSVIMGANLWPALSESTKLSPKSSGLELKVVSDESSAASSQGPIIVHSPHKQASSSGKSNSTHNPGLPGRSRSFKRGGGGGGGNSNSGGGHAQSSGFSHPPPPPPPPPPFPVIAMIPNGFASMVPTIPDQGPREPPYRGNNWEQRPVGGFTPPPHMVNDPGHSPRRSNFRPRGDGSNHNNSGGRRDQDRGHYGSGRDAHVQPQRGQPRAFVRHPPPNAANFIPPQPMRPFMNPVVYPGQEVVYVPTLPIEHYRMPFIPPTPAMIVPVQDQSLPAMLVRQIEYYFSDANLIKDDYLKSNMDGQGWVPITLIAGFNRVKTMTTDIGFILDSLRTSTFLETQDDKVRRRNDWTRWILNSNHDVPTTSFQQVTLDDVAAEPDDSIRSLQYQDGINDPSVEMKGHLQAAS